MFTTDYHNDMLRRHRGAVVRHGSWWGTPL